MELAEKIALIEQAMRDASIGVGLSPERVLQRTVAVAVVIGLEMFREELKTEA